MDTQNKPQETIHLDHHEIPTSHEHSEPASARGRVEPTAADRAIQPRASRLGSKPRRLLLTGLLLLLGLTAVIWLWPSILRAFNTISTDDAYVAGHVTYVASRLPGMIVKVHVDDNQYVTKDQILVELDPELYQIAVKRATAAVAMTKAQVHQAAAQGKAVVASIRAAWNNVRLTMDQVVEQIQKLKASVATLGKASAQRVLAEAELRRARNLLASNSGTQQLVDQRDASYQIAAATEIEARSQVLLNRAAIGLPIGPLAGQQLGDVPDQWEKKVPVVRAALAELINAGVKIGLDIPPIEDDPETVYANFKSNAPGGDLDKYLNQLAENWPAIEHAKAEMDQAQHGLDQARLDLRDTQIRSELSGFISRRIANPGNRVQAGQGMMAIRPLDQVWIEANFKETQIAALQIGQQVDIRADAYPGHIYRGRLTGFSSGTGAATALLPPENATGNFVKVVQRLPVRIDLIDGNPPEAPLFVGLSVQPAVLLHLSPTGPFAGQKLQHLVGLDLPLHGSNPRPTAPSVDPSILLPTTPQPSVTIPSALESSR